MASYHEKKTFQCRAVSLCFWHEIMPFSAVILSISRWKRGLPTPWKAILHRILHPVLHPKSSVITIHFPLWCRKCRIFSKNFFRREEMLHCGSCKTSDFFGQKYGCFASKVRMFASKKSDVFDFRKGGSVEYGFIWFNRFYPADDINVVGNVRPEGARLLLVFQPVQNLRSCPCCPLTPCKQVVVNHTQ